VTGKADRRERKKERTRQLLLDVAIRLIAERGIYGTRVEDITERSDLGKGAFYNYFESKDRLIAELVSQGIELLHRRYLAEPPAVSTRGERIAAVIAGHEAFFDDHPAYLILFHQARGLAKVRADDHEALAGVFLEYLRRTGAAIATPDERLQLTEPDLLDLAAVVLGAVAGYRSFTLAARLERRSAVVQAVLSDGMPAVLDRKLRAP
jgi:AcrR family transcriptional regulator